jgi:hypothetical protein
LLDQVVDAVRSRLVTEATSGGSAGGATLTSVARRLVAIDPDRAGIGGLRLQLELALFAGLPSVPVSQAAAAPRPTTEPPQPAGPQLTPEPPAPTQPRAARASGTPAPQAAVPARADETARPRPERDEPTTDRPASAKPSAQAGDARNGAAADTTEPAAGATDAPAPATAEPAAEAIEQPVPATAESAAVAPSEPAAAPTRPASEVQAAGTSAPTSLASNGTELSLDRIVAAWPDIVAILSRQPAIKQLILTCRPVALDGLVVTLGYPEEQAFLREIAERKKAGIEAGIREVIGHDVGVRCVVANIEVAATGGEDGFLMAEARRIFGDDLADVVEID